MLIVPCRLRIVGYSPSPLPQYANRPTIHLEGDMGGAEWDAWDDTRRLHGTVGMIADGSVRWCLVSLYCLHEYKWTEAEIFTIRLTKYSTEVGSDEDQWVSEGIQVGGVGSGIGVLGMWTGAIHESSDPLGERLIIPFATLPYLFDGRVIAILAFERTSLSLRLYSIGQSTHLNAVFLFTGPFWAWKVA